MPGFPSRYKTFTPEGYAELRFQLRVNPTNAELITLAGPYQEPDARAKFGAALVQAYAGAKVEAYDRTFDFSTAEAALATIEAVDLPDDLQAWLRNAPCDVAIREREYITKNYQEFSPIGK